LASQPADRQDLVNMVGYTFFFNISKTWLLAQSHKKSNMAKKYTTGMLAALTLAFIATSENLYAQAFTDNTVDAGPSLPIKLLSFSARRQAADVELNWATSAERNNRHFNIERATDGVSFNTMATVMGSGSTAALVSYHFTDVKAPATKLYYRLLQVDFDGKSTHSPVVVVQANPTQVATLSVAPNPTRGNLLTVKFENLPAGRYTISITGANGARVYQRMHQQAVPMAATQFLIDQKLPVGLYVLSAANGALRLTQRLVVQE
jgi:hypothetical protein